MKATLACGCGSTAVFEDYRYAGELGYRVSEWQTNHLACPQTGSKPTPAKTQMAEVRCEHGRLDFRGVNVECSNCHRKGISAHSMNRTITITWDLA